MVFKPLVRTRDAGMIVEQSFQFMAEMNLLSDRLAQRLPFFYGYLMLPLAMFMQIGTSPGQTFAVSAFTPALLSSLSLSQSQLGLAYMLGTVLAAIPLSTIGPAADRHGLKRISMLVIGALAGACVIASLVNGFYGLFAAFFLLRFLGQGSLTLLAGNTTAMWFRTRIGRVSAILSIGSAIAFAWIPGFLEETIGIYGWRQTYRLMAAVLVVFLMPLILLLYRDKPEDLGQSVDGRNSIDPADSTTRHRVLQESKAASDSANEPDSDWDSLTLSQAARTGSYYILAFSNVVWAMAGTGVLFYLFTLCDQRDLPAGTAKMLFKVLGIAMLVAQLAGGVLADFSRLGRLFGCGATMIAVSLIWLLVDTTATGGAAFAMLFGAGQGMLISVSGVAWVRFYGRRNLGKIRGTVWCGTVAGSGCGPLIMGLVQDLTGNYNQAIMIFAAAMSPLAFFAWFIRPPAIAQRNAR